MENRICTRCKIDKNLNQFYVDNRNKTGFSSQCKQCMLITIHKRQDIYRRFREKFINSDQRYAPRKCQRCGIVKEGTMFHANRCCRNGFIGTCKSCASIYNIQYRKNKDEKKKKEYDWKYNLKKFGLTIDEFKYMLDKQRGLCAICGKPEISKCRGKTRNLAIDHCHITGKRRQLLCVNCNHILGKCKDDVDILLEAVNYLENHRAS